MRLTPSTATNPFGAIIAVSEAGVRYAPFALPFAASREHARGRVDVSVDQVSADAIAEAQARTRR